MGQAPGHWQRAQPGRRAPQGRARRQQARLLPAHAARARTQPPTSPLGPPAMLSSCSSSSSLLLLSPPPPAAPSSSSAAPLSWSPAEPPPPSSSSASPSCAARRSCAQDAAGVNGGAKPNEAACAFDETSVPCPLSSCFPGEVGPGAPCASWRPGCPRRRCRCRPPRRAACRRRQRPAVWCRIGSMRWVVQTAPNRVRTAGGVARAGRGRARKGTSAKAETPGTRLRLLSGRQRVVGRRRRRLWRRLSLLELTHPPRAAHERIDSHAVLVVGRLRAGSAQAAQQWAGWHKFNGLGGVGAAAHAALVHAPLSAAR